MSFHILSSTHMHIFCGTTKSYRHHDTSLNPSSISFLGTRTVLLHNYNTIMTPQKFHTDIFKYSVYVQISPIIPITTVTVLFCFFLLIQDSIKDQALVVTILQSSSIQKDLNSFYDTDVLKSPGSCHVDCPTVLVCLIISYYFTQVKRFGKNCPSHHIPSGAHNLSIIGESEFDHLLKVESAKFPQYRDAFFPL